MAPQPGQLGIVTRPGSTPVGRNIDAALNDRPQRPLVQQFPQAITYQFGFRALPLANTAIAASDDAWYKLASVTPEELGTQFFWMGYRCEMNACDVDGAGDDDFPSSPDVQPWGNATGSGAAIVIGLNLPGSLGSWSSGPATTPFVRSFTGRITRLNNDRVVLSFPTGKYNDAPRPAILRANQTTPLAHLVKFGQRLDVSLVVGRGFVNNVTKSTGIVGRVFGDVILAGPEVREQMTQ
jgi:hypothetical protein